jgi:hypothetical protein
MPAEGKSLPSAFADGLILLAERLSVLVRLLEVVADDLLKFRESLCALLLEPVGEVLMKLGAQLLGRSFVRSLADKNVDEPKRVVAGGTAIRPAE